MSARIKIIYASSNSFKKQEARAICDTFEIPIGIDGAEKKIGELFEFEFRKSGAREILVRDLEQMMHHKARSAYEVLQVPCIVEHAGLLFENLKSENYPGGLTQPMWDALGAERFITETGSANRRAIARAVIGYCDGMSIKTFVGETRGTIVSAPRGSREFYWDTVFRPHDPDTDKPYPQTYAEMAGDENSDGLIKKLRLSQSTKAMLQFLKYRLAAGDPELFPSV